MQTEDFISKHLGKAILISSLIVFAFWIAVVVASSMLVSEVHDHGLRAVFERVVDGPKEP